MSWKKILQPPKNWEIHGGKKRKIVIGIVIFLMFFLLSPHLEDILSARQEYIAGQDTIDWWQETPTPPITTPPPPEEEDKAHLSFYVPEDEIRIFIVDPHYQVPIENSPFVVPPQEVFDYLTGGGVFTCILDIPIQGLQLRIPHPFVKTFSQNEAEQDTIPREPDVYDPIIPEGVTVADKPQWYALYSSWVDFDVSIIGVDATGKKENKVMTGVVLGSRVRGDYDEKRPSGTLPLWHGKMDESNPICLEVAFQGELTDIRYFEVTIEGKVIRDRLPQDIKEALGDAYGVKPPQPILDHTETVYPKRKQAELLDILIEAICWSKDMEVYHHEAFHPESSQSGSTTYTENPEGFKRDQTGVNLEFDQEALDNPEIGKPIYKTDKDTIIEWGALEIKVKYNFPEEFKDILDYYIAVRFPDPSYQPFLVANVQKSDKTIIRTSTDQINTISFYKPADMIDSNSPDALVWYWDSSEKMYKGRKPKDKERKWIWVPIINGKFTEQKIQYKVYFTTFYKDKKNAKGFGEIVDNASFTLSLNAGQVYRIGTKMEDKCRDWLEGKGFKKILPEKVRSFFYTLCIIEHSIHKSMKAVKDLSSYILAGGPKATIDMARKYGGKGSVATAVLLSAIMYIAFILALLIFIVGILGMNLDMAWFGVRIWIFLLVFSYLQVIVGEKFETPYGMFSLVKDFFDTVYHFAYSLFKDITSDSPQMWGIVAIGILFIWLLSRRGS
ncbi:hypothetical protein DRN58_03140 [Thermococci archaeon]|nr:MAG: hypothetical protein DRN58_03140 [Thermococci archaeon]